MSLNEILVTEVKGVGKAMVEKLAQLKIVTVKDLLEYFPYRYENYELIDIHHAMHEEKITVEAKVITACSVQYYGKMKARMSFNVLVNHEVVKVVVFNRQFLKNQLKLDTLITVTGKWDLGRKVITATDIIIGSAEGRGIEPVYSLKEIPTKTFKKIVKAAYEQFHSLINDDLPLDLQQSYRLISYKDAVSFAHFPKNKEQVRQVERRIKYEELLKFQLKIQYLRHQTKHEKVGANKCFDEMKVEQFIHQLPFQLTEAQLTVLSEIKTDLMSPTRMNRLLQGDVGSGKTVVAAVSLFMTMLAGFQTALMVPTEILGQQHYKSFCELFSPFKEVNIEFLSSSVKGKRRREILEKLRQGEINLLVGTHAIIQQEVVFQNLGLVITDEQHRFGVNQRKMLREKGEFVDVLMMTATPIPRTLAISAFGDMDVSTITQMPKGRKPVETYLIDSGKLDRALNFIQDEILSKGQQAYVITPLIEESEAMDVQNAVEVYHLWQHHFQGRAKVGLMHGRLSQAEKDAVMDDFVANRSQILISTTVIEVGVNVPNANLMLIYDAHRFGLSQLHQLRGRVGRGSEQAYCLLMSDIKNEASLERLTIMTQTTNGFEISEADLKLRGPGDFFGEKQSGVPVFKMADLVQDFNILQVAMQDAYRLVSSDEFKQNNLYLPLRDYIESTVANEMHQFD
ncbi:MULTISPECIES: ATP-dependent DNA helicase RecG [Turicibacter]|jgi:ATP-dependent DNA helicase recG|uniref:ATP-dependent DNA helicase RecG n=3 Tax=Turicibacter sanguinis TaxID=154288 RepID=A0A9X4XAR1_9FIRM|nr:MULTISPECIES: ATP-dependent DNA helicase RecG [Turicibacter]EFF63315.1 ATP-dependent DNA helicase RecG [Turicibacter sanguinis PC909]EGC92261.1 ATP-dependent DNA helicase RecG [Turicibacter sp. HGF1]MBP3903414.1 ATP-dependent DNA helicase RecG [Turicibacter sp.]MCU7190716.1 ATP-dependent DNA helicase RecG [Turicibacter sanguinis]MCU7211284.1 ATP-dependent DNA helicase RecG [Turicibacter sanguinis]